jgi:hypothetical protein
MNAVNLVNPCEPFHTYAGEKLFIILYMPKGSKVHRGS